MSPVAQQVNPQLVKELLEAIAPLMEKYPEDFLALTQMNPAQLLELLQNFNKPSNLTQEEK